MFSNISSCLVVLLHHHCLCARPSSELHHVGFPGSQSLSHSVDVSVEWVGVWRQRWVCMVCGGRAVW